MTIVTWRKRREKWYASGVSRTTSWSAVIGSGKPLHLGGGKMYYWQLNFSDGSRRMDGTTSVDDSKAAVHAAIAAFDEKVLNHAD